MKNNPNVNKKLETLFFILGGVFIANIILAELMGMKIFSLTQLLKDTNLSFFQNFSKDLNMSVGILIWPFVFILSDIVNEYFGRSGVQKISFLAATLIVYSSVLIIVATTLPPAGFWQELNGKDSAGNFLDINSAYSIIFKQGISIIVGSITAFLLSQMVDVYTFHYIRKITGHKKLWMRATGSTVVSQIIDSYVILFVAFYLLGPWSLAQVLAVGTLQYVYKVSFAILLTPVIYFAHFIIDRYIGKDGAHDVIESTDKNW